MKKTIRIQNKNDLVKIREKIEKNICIVRKQLQNFLESMDTLQLFHEIKFHKTVSDPLTEEPENFLEVVNQYYTYLVSLNAVEMLMEIHKGHAFILNLGNVNGYDIVSEDASIIAECFAATSYRSNRKLSKDLERLSRNKDAAHKYVFFYDMEFTEQHKPYYVKKYPDIVIQKILI